jgi:hypothetical protein
MTRPARWIVLAFLLGAAATTAGAARGAEPDTPAVRAFHEGQQAYRKGDFRAAANAFEAAYRDDPRGAIVFNAGLSWQAAGDTPRAADAYASALATSDLPADSAADARTRLDALEKSLGRIDVDAPPGSRVTVAQADRLLAPAKVHVTPGTYVVQAMLPDGSTRSRRVTVRAGEWAGVAIAPAPPPPVEPPAPTPAAPAAPATAAGESQATAGGSAQRTWGWIALGGAAVLAGVSSVLTAQFFDANHTNDEKRTQATHDDAVAAATRLDVALAATAVAAGVGAWLLISAPSPSSARRTAELGLSLAPGGLALRARF